MLIGNPDGFAVWYDSVDLWSTDNFKNGCFSYFIGGDLIWSLDATIDVDVNLLSSLNCLESDVEDAELFNLPASVSYERLVERAFPKMDSNVEMNDYRNLVSVGSLLDAGFQVFIIEFEDQAKLVWGRRGKDDAVHELILKRGEFQGVVRDVISRFGFPAR
ncbi:immunity 42 family protein [Burkholderia gladioli]|uniref:immunity 42 family protein n=1 Tax=Burkholderia gladioli TaxID=28095 RepID=UPI001640A3E4|nr:immunity 42 family protein [Burkholderia gladioli]